MNIINLIKSWWPVMVGLVLIGIFAFQEVRISYYQAKLEACNIKIKQSELLLEQQNAAIRSLKIESDNQEKKLRQAEKNANAIREASYLQIQDILHAKIPASCEGALKWGVIKASSDSL